MKPLRARDQNPTAITKSDLEKIRALIYKETGMLFEDNKNYYLEGRVKQRMSSFGAEDFKEYYHELLFGSRGGELKAFVEAITINETYFFRDFPQLQGFADEVLTSYAKAKAAKNDFSLHVWSAACSTGEEGYTLSIILQEILDDDSRWRFKVDATDIDRAVLEKAKKGIYGERSMKDTPVPYRQKYFSQRTDGWQVLKNASSLVSFRELNLIDHEQMSKMKNYDFIFCRNVLIYFDLVSQKKVLAALFESLRPGGYLFLGHSESVGRISNAFALEKVGGKIRAADEGIPQEAIEDFFSETSENLDHADQCLRSLEQNRGDSTPINELFRVIHTIKGGSSYLRFEDLRDLSHQFENLLEVVRATPHQRVLESFLNLAFEATSGLRKMLTILIDRRGKMNVKPLVKKMAIYTVKFKALKEKKERHAHLAAKRTDRDALLSGVTKSSTANFECDKPDVQGLGIEEPSQLPKVQSTTMRIEQKHLDQMMNLIGELIVAKNAMEHLQSNFAGAQDQDQDQRPLALSQFREQTARLGSVSEQMQQTMRKLRLVPLKSIFQRYPSIVRELGRITGKKVQLVITSDHRGSDIEIDKKIADEISDPIMHLIRNAIDHGIEPEGVRLTDGKPASGLISLTAHHEHSSVVITISDDGAGIDPLKIKQFALAKGFIASQDAKNLSPQEILNLIFKPGLTTAARVTEVSGRGVGLDIVSSKISAIHGKLSVRTELGKGTSFRFELPTSVSVLESLLVSTHDQIFALPLRNILETIRIRTDELKPLMNKKAFTLRNEVIGVEWLSSLLGTGRETSAAENHDAKLRVLIIQSGQQKLGVVVDHIVRNQEIVVKPLPSSLSDVPGLSGASILGDGRAVFIIDPAIISMPLMRGA